MHDMHVCLLDHENAMMCCIQFTSCASPPPTNAINFSCQQFASTLQAMHQVCMAISDLHAHYMLFASSTCKIPPLNIQCACHLRMPFSLGSYISTLQLPLIGQTTIVSYNLGLEMSLEIKFSNNILNHIAHVVIRNTLFDPKHLNTILQNKSIYLGSRRLLLRLGYSHFH